LFLQINVEILPAEGDGEGEGDDRLASLVSKGLLTSTLALPETVTVTLTSPGAGGCSTVEITSGLGKPPIFLFSQYRDTRFIQASCKIV
jgi:hypothetical protein